MYHKYIQKISFLIVSLLLLSCSAESDYDLGKSKTPIDGKAQIALELPSTKSDEATTRAGDNETLINSLSLFLFDSATGNKEFSIRLNVPYTGSSSDIDMSRWASDQVIMILNSTILSDLNKSRNIHIVANMNEDKLNSISNESNLKAVITDAIAAEIADPSETKPFVMHGVKNNHNFATDIRASVSLVRNVAKVNTTVNTTNFTFGGKNIQLVPQNKNLSLTMVNVADRSYLVQGTTSPAATTHFSYAAKIATPSERTASTTKSIAHTYINENLLSTYDLENNATYILLQIPYQKDGSTDIITDNYYKVLINSQNGYKINRNTIYDMVLNISSLGGETDASAVLLEGTLNILPWDENTVISDLSQTFLTVQETITQVAVNKDFTYATNADLVDCSLESGAAWLTATFDAPSNKIKLVASGTDYTAPRATTLKIKVKNLTKTITVNQEAIPVASGSIKLDPKLIYLSEVSTSTYKDVNLTINPTTSSWRNIEGNTSVASPNFITGTGNKTIRFTRGTTYDNSDFKFMNTSTLEYDVVRVCNLNLTSSLETIEVPGDGLSDNDDGIIALGGDANWVVKSKSSWITKAQNEGGKLVYIIPAEPNEQDRDGEIIINHINDVNLTRTIKIKQSAKYIRFDEFDFLLITYDWTYSNGKDLDTATEFRGTQISSVDYKTSGWSFGNIVYDSYNKKILEWGGDNQAVAGSENLVLYMENLCSANNMQYFRQKEIRYVYIDLYATWYSTADKNSPIKLKMKSFKGGAMVKDPSTVVSNSLYGTFTNPTGTAGISWEGERLILTDQGNNDFRNNYTKMGIIRYDIEKNEASATIGSTTNPFMGRSKHDEIPLLPGESKEEYGVRLNRYYNKNNK